MDDTICKYSPCDIVLLTENIKYPMDKCFSVLDQQTALSFQLEPTSQRQQLDDVNIHDSNINNDNCIHKFMKTLNLIQSHICHICYTSMILYKAPYCIVPPTMAFN